MLGWIICREGRCGRLQRRLVCGVPFLALEVPRVCRGKDRRRLAAALREMARCGVRRAVVQGGVLPELAAFGMLPVDPFALRTALLPQLLAWIERAQGWDLKKETVLLSADSSGDTVWRAAVELSRRARYVLVDTGPGQTVLEEALRQRLGISAGGGEALLEVCMGSCPRSRLPQLHLGVGCAQRQRLDLWWPKLPEAEESMLCALFLAEKIPIKEIYVRFVEFRA